jgi:hypothetical protein
LVISSSIETPSTDCCWFFNCVVTWSCVAWLLAAVLTTVPRPVTISWKAGMIALEFWMFAIAVALLPSSGPLPLPAAMSEGFAAMLELTAILPAPLPLKKAPPAAPLRS